ncbi:hypothetical protein L7F22_039539 [Adiantum nelumboides]|nr:hypothetical protein [Adiantum nelumboides]
MRPFSWSATIKKDYGGSKEGKFLQGETFSSWFLGLTSKGCNVLELDDAALGFFEEVLYVDIMSKLEETNQNRSQSGTNFVKVHSMDVYEMLSQIKKVFDDVIEVQVETNYKMIAKKMKPVATPLPKGSNEVIKEAFRQPMLGTPKNIRHKFTEETLKQLNIGKDGSLLKRRSSVSRRC